MVPVDINFILLISTHTRYSTCFLETMTLDSAETMLVFLILTRPQMDLILFQDLLTLASLGPVSVNPVVLAVPILIGTFKVYVVVFPYELKVKFQKFIFHKYLTINLCLVFKLNQNKVKARSKS